MINLKRFDKFAPKEPYYNGYRLLSLQDVNGMRPEIYVVTTNRSAGKTYFYSGMCVHRFIQRREKFVLLYRYKYELENCASTFFAQIGPLFFPGLTMEQETGVRLVYDKLYLAAGKERICCGYCTSLNASGGIKTNSARLSDANRILFDEAFPEDDRYLPDEMTRFMSIHDSLARGGGEQARYLPVYIVGNPINIFNPYYETFGIVDSLRSETNFLRGDGFVVEQGFNQAAADAHAQSAFHRAMGDSRYKKLSQEKTYLNTSYEMIDNKLVDCGLYICTIMYKSKMYSVRYNENLNIFYVSDTPDPSCRICQAATEADISEQAIFDPYGYHRTMLKKKYRQNCVRFKSLAAREALQHFMIGK